MVLHKQGPNLLLFPSQLQIFGKTGQYSVDCEDFGNRAGTSGIDAAKLRSMDMLKLLSR
jgi:hypothetical protein